MGFLADKQVESISGGRAGRTMKHILPSEIQEGKHYAIMQERNPLDLSMESSRTLTAWLSPPAPGEDAPVVACLQGGEGLVHSCCFLLLPFMPLFFLSVCAA